MIAKNSYKALLALALIISVSFIRPQRTQACGPFFSDAIFVYSKHPDMPLENFAAGKLGVLQVSWARSYLVAAYRNLAGTSLSPDEAKGIKSLWDDRLGNNWESHDEDWIKKWNEARKQVPGTGTAAIKAYRNQEKPHEYESFLNCQQDAFENAETTLSERIKRFSADSAAVKDWLLAQDQVFANCGEGKVIPEAAGANSDPLIRADRAYQIGAANFYATNFDEATKQFDAIAQDKSSPWRDKAGYLAARSLLRKGSLADKEETGRPAMAEAEARLNAILKDSSAQASHQAATRLLNLVRLRLHPEEKLHEIAHTLVKKDRSGDFKQAVWDYTILLDKFLGEDDDEADAAAKKARPAGLTGDELTDWVITFEDSSPAAAAHSLQQWEKGKALPWLLAAISKANGQQPGANALLAAAATVDHNSPAFPSLAYHSMRLLIESNRGSEARAALDKILTADRQRLSPSALNLFLAQRTNVAQNLDEFLQNAPRVPAGFSDDSDGREIPDDDSTDKTKGPQLFFDLDGANAFNKAMPVAMIKDAARSKTLAPNLRQDVTQAAFVRAALIDDHETANQAAILLQEVYPKLKEFLGAYQKAATPDARRFAAAFLTLKFPGLRPYVSAGTGRTTALEEIDSYRDNYWCAEPRMPENNPMGDEEDKAKTKPIAVPEFLKGSKALATSQFAALQALGTAPDYFCKTAIAWAEKNPADPRAPEALHLAVRSTRYGCTDDQTGRWSKAAYDLLHSRYPNTTWAKNTKYWFK